MWLVLVVPLRRPHFPATELPQLVPVFHLVYFYSGSDSVSPTSVLTESANSVGFFPPSVLIDNSQSVVCVCVQPLEVFVFLQENWHGYCIRRPPYIITSLKASGRLAQSALARCWNCPLGVLALWSVACPARYYRGRVSLGYLVTSHRDTLTLPLTRAALLYFPLPALPCINHGRSGDGCRLKCFPGGHQENYAYFLCHSLPRRSVFSCYDPWFQLISIQCPPCVKYIFLPYNLINHDFISAVLISIGQRQQCFTTERSPDSFRVQSQIQH